MATNDKYDRQLRLWGAAGQKALGETCVVLIHATAAGTETVKNLVLPGIGSILVLDSVAAVTTEYASNFFLVKDSTKPRAQMAMEYLRELNPDVQGSWKHMESLLSFDFESAFASSKEKLLVVASDLEPPLLDKVGTACENQKIPLVVVHSYGLLGIVRLQTPPLPLMNPKPRDAPPDLRLVHPFAALQDLANSIDWNSLKSHEHSHVPYPLILLRVSKEWKSAHDGKLPQNFAEKQAFQDLVRKASRNFDREINFEEACNNAYTAYAARELDLDHLASLRDAAAESCPSLLLMLQALDQFLQKHANQPPVQGTIPDMTASTELYVRLQKVYREQADKDLQEMRALIPDTVSDDQVATFCQNVFALDLLKTRSLREEYHGDTVPEEISDDLAMATMEDDERRDQVPLLWYLGFRACQLFHRKHGRYPGVLEDYEQDVTALQSCIVEVVRSYRLQENELVKDTLLKNNDYATELTRYGNAEIHNVASVIGGVASQEAVKIITGQYVPFNNTYIYNGIASVGGVYRF